MRRYWSEPQKSGAVSAEERILVAVADVADTHCPDGGGDREQTTEKTSKEPLESCPSETKGKEVGCREETIV